MRWPSRSNLAVHSPAGGGRIGDAAYAELIAEQLALDNVLKHYMRGAANGPAVDHFLASYETGLRVRTRIWGLRSRAQETSTLAQTGAELAWHRCQGRWIRSLPAGADAALTAMSSLSLRRLAARGATVDDGLGETAHKCVKYVGILGGMAADRACVLTGSVGSDITGAYIVCLLSSSVSAASTAGLRKQA